MPDNKDKKLVRVMYGHAKDPWNYGPWSAFFDLILSYGQYSQKFLSLYENSVIVGNPKFDDWFSDKIDQEQISILKSALDSSKKTILYLPTTGALSSLPIMITALNSLSADYNVIVKAHHNTNLYQQDMLEPFRLNSQIIIKTDKDDILPLLKMADYAISDNSGAIFDALLADKKIILIDFLNENFFKNRASILCRNAWGRHMGVITSKESIEQSIKRPGQEIGPIVKLQKTDAIFRRQIEPDKIIQAMASADQDEPTFAGRRKKIRDLSFSYNDGQSGLRAAQKISELLHKPKKMPSFLAESLELYYNSFITREIGLPPQNPWKSKGGQREAARRYFEIKELPLKKKIMAVYKEFFE
jgi:CDP-glycerol glycerophosphotransferase (TagB/SpsB family)